ncbi:MAG: hypothetical protein M0R06_23315 [Sphaerochaeta sp.]|jgi:HK97 gp10 family phage protein|nr:hypothetical protein [Sphaerochaeta sp.]
MMTIEVKGLAEATQKFSAAPQRLVSELGKAMRQSVRDLHRQAVREAPVNKQSGGGNLRQMIGSSASGLKGSVVAKASYSAYVHEGTKPHIIVPRRARVLANKRTGQFFGRKVNHPGTKANPFLARALEKITDKIAGHFNAALKNILK